MAQQPEKVIRCGECNRVVVHIENGQVIVNARHNGEWHRTTLPVELSKSQ